MVKVKLKTNKTRVYEAYSKNTVQNTMGVKMKSSEENQRELAGLWGRLMKQKSIDLRKLYKGATMKDMGYSIPVSKMRVPVKVKITDAITGEQTEEEIIPAEIASFCEMAKTQAASTRELGPILGRFNKPILWSFNIDTAASDGVRIAFNPVFAEQLLYKGKGQVKELMSQGKRMSQSDRVITMARLVLYVICHEAYHQIYRHREQAERKTETQGGKNHRLANIAMDAEINRDLEKQIPKYFAGATEECQGIFDDRFRMEPWQVIFDAYFYNKVSTPQQPINQNPVNNSQQQSGQQGQSGDSQSSQSQQQGQNGQQGDNSQSQGQSSSQGQQSDSSQQQSGNQGSQSQSGNQNNQSGDQSDNQQGQSNGSYDDTDLSAADPDTMSDYGMDDMPDNSDKSSEYQDAYNDEIKKELDKAMGKGSGSDSDEQGDDNSQDGNGSQSGNSDDSENSDEYGNSGDEECDGDNQGQTGNDSGDSSDGQSGQQGEMSQSSQGSMGNSKTGRNSGQMSPTEKAAREQARKDVKKAIDKMKSQIDKDMNSVPDEDKVQEQLEGKEFDTTTSSTFGGADMLSQEQMAEIAKESGDPYTAEELTCDPVEISRKYNEENKDRLNQVSPDLANKLNDIADKLKNMESLANWKQKMKKHFTAAMEAGTQMKRSKRTMSQSWRDDRYNPYKKVPFTENNAANIFYLIDNSGSMYGNGNGIFYQIFKEIVTLEKQCKVLNSARAYFTTGAIHPEDVEMWNIKTPISKRLELLGERGGSGGTDIPGNTISVTKLKKPYYYDNGEKHTTIMVFTDGEDSGWEQLKQIPSKIRKDIVFVVFNPNVKFILQTFREMQTLGGISLKNLIGIDTSKFGIKSV